MYQVVLSHETGETVRFESESLEECERFVEENSSWIVGNSDDRELYVIED